MANEFIIKNGFQSKGDSQVTGSLNLSGDITVGQYITHAGDTDTQINFLDDEIRFEAGNLLLFDIHKKGSAPHEITVNNGGNNVDFIIEDDAGNAYFIADASTTRIGIGTSTPQEALTVTGNISASGNISTLGDITSSGNIAALDLNLTGGDIDLKNAGAQSNIKFYCESSNAHHTKLQAAAHADYSGDVTTTLAGYDFDFKTPNFQANVTASGNISSSGTFIGDGSTLTNLQRPITTVGTNPFTASLATAGGYYRVGGNVTCSILLNATASCPIGSEFEFIQTSSAGYLFFETGSANITLNSKNGNVKLAGQFSGATLKKINDDEWDLIGDLG
jgi:hypothetical protein